MCRSGMDIKVHLRKLNLNPKEITTKLNNNLLEFNTISKHVIKGTTSQLYVAFLMMYFLYLQEIEVLRKQNVQLSEENGKLVGHKNHKQRIEYLVKLKKENTKLHEVTHLKYMHR